MKVVRIISFIAGVATFIILRKFAGLGFILSFIASTAATILLTKILKQFIREGKSNVLTRMVPETEQSKQVVDEGMKRIRNMRNLSRMIPKNDVAAKVQAICKVGTDIFENLSKKPEDLKRAKPFTTYYLESTEKIINQYVEFSSRKEITPEFQETINKIESMLDQIKATFDKQLTNMFENDLMDINTELKVLENTMKMEG